MRDRLIYLITEMENELCRAYPYTTETFRIEKVAEYLLANGVIVTPCKVGDKVYVLNVPKYGKVHGINRATVVGFHLGDFGKLLGHKRKEYLCVVYDTSPYITHIPLDRIGKTVFLTKEEAEQALKEREQNGR